VEAAITKRPEDAGLQYLLGRIHVANKNWGPAEKALRQAIEIRPGFSGAYVLLSHVYRVTGNTAKTLAELESAMAARPDDTSTLMLAAGLHIADGQDQKAVDLYRRMLKKHPDSVSALNNLAVLYSRQPERLDEASELAQKAHDLVPQDASVMDTLAWVLHLRGDSRRALSLLRRSVEKSSWHPEIQYHLGVVHCALGNEKAARAALDAALAGDGDAYGVRDKAQALVRILQVDMTKPLDAQTVATLEEVAEGDPGYAAALVRLGVAAEKAGAWEKAEQHYRAVLAARPSHVLALKVLARLYLSRPNKAEAALETAKTARGLAPEDNEVLVLLGRAAYANGDAKWAASLLQESVRSAPGETLSPYYLGLASYACGRLGKAEAAFKLIATPGSVLPEAADAKRILALMRVARERTHDDAAKGLVARSLAADERDIPALMAKAALQLAADDPQGAGDTYEGITRFAPAFAPAMAELARLYADRKDKAADALAMAKKARELLPEDPRVAEVLGTIACRQGDYEWATSLLSEALRGTGPTAELLYLLGTCEFHGKNKTASLKHLRDALNIAGDDFAHRQQAERMIKELE